MASGHLAMSVVLLIVLFVAPAKLALLTPVFGAFGIATVVSGFRLDDDDRGTTIGLMGILGVVFAAIVFCSGVASSTHLSFGRWLLLLSMFGYITGVAFVLRSLISQPGRERSLIRAIWLPVLLGFCIGVGVCRNDSLAVDSSLTGRWQSNEYPEKMIEFTARGKLLYDRDGYSEVGLFSVSGDRLRVDRGDSTGGYESRYEVEFLGQDEVVLACTEDGLYFDNLAGRWQRLTPDAQAENSTQENQLTELIARRDDLHRLLIKRDAERSLLLKRLDSQSPNSEAWLVQARELRSVVIQINVLMNRLDTFESVIAKLETMTRSKQRTLELEQLGLTTQELNQLSQSTYELDHQLRSTMESGEVSDFELRAFIENQHQPKESK